MKPTLFWKILGTVWLMIALVNVSDALIVLAYPRWRQEVRAAITAPAQRDERLLAARIALKYGGRPAVDELASTWPKTARAGLRVTQGPTGRTVLTLPPQPNHGILVLWWPPAILFAASLLFSALLAANLARPVSQLRDGFRKVSSGDLDVRLTASMGRRRDEIAELARDFDAMVEQLKQSIAARDRLLHDVSHELRSPLARMSVAIGLARIPGDMPEHALSRIETESARLNEIVGDLLSLSRAESDVRGEEIYFDLGGLLRVICEDARFEARPRGVSVQLDLSPAFEDPDRAPPLKGSPQLLRRGIENIVRNALRFSQPGDTVFVAAGIVDRRIIIKVRDNGPGVPPELLETMFEPFVKGAAESRGVGLGLTIARRALAAYGGAVQAFNVDRGGLLVRIDLPVPEAGGACGRVV
jgi:two-component system OmpR family sensor kinase